MGRKSRAIIEEELNKQRYLRYQKILSDPEYKALWKKLNKINKKLKTNANDVKLWSEKESIEKELKSKYCLAIPVIEYSIWEILTEDEKGSLELPIDPANPLTEDEFKYFIESICPIFRDMDIVRIIPAKKPKLIQTDDPPVIKGKKREQTSEKRIWSKIDYTGFLKDGRYLKVEIDTWNKIERIVAALKDKLEFLQDLGVMRFKSRFHLSTDEERIRVRELRDQGMFEKEIARFLWPKEYDEEEARIAEIDDLNNKEKIKCRKYALELSKEGRKWPDAWREAQKKFPSRKLPVNRLIKKVSRLLSEIPQ